MATSFGQYYRLGTVTVTNGSTTVSGSGVIWSDVVQGDILECAGMQATVDSVNDDMDEITLMLPWAGSTASAQTYVVRKDAKGRYDPALTQAKVREFIAMLDDASILYGVTGAAPDDTVGEDGQWALKTNDGPWSLWLKVDGAWVLQGPPVGGLAYDVGGFSPDRPGSGENILSWLFTRTVTFPVNLSGSKAKCENAPTADAVSSIFQTGTTAAASVTISNASPGVVTHTTHGKSNGDRVKFKTTGALPAGLSVDTWYYVVNKATSTYQVAATPGGTAINTTSAGSGTHTAVYSVKIGTVTIAAGATTGTFAMASQAVFGAGEVLDTIGPIPHDATMTDLHITLIGVRN